MQVEEIFPGVFEMRTSYGTDTAGLITDGAPLPHVAWYVRGPNAALLDPGPTVVAQEALEAISDLGDDLDDLAYAIPSHIHVDHAGAAGWLAKQLPRVKVVIHRSGTRFLTDTSRLRTGTEAVFGPGWEREIFGSLIPVPEERLIHAEEGMVLDAGGREQRIVHLPGHSPDQIGVYDPAYGALYCGHAIGQFRPGFHIPDPPATLPYFDVEATLTSLDRIRRMQPRYLLTVHFGGIYANPEWLVDSAERVTRELWDLVRQGTEEGLPLETIEERVRVHLFADPRRADHSYHSLVRGYQGYLQRQERRQG